MHEPTPNGGNYVCVYNKTRERFVATHAQVADGYFSRLVGLLGTTRRWARPGKGLWIVPSHGVHTIGMLYALDLVFLDRDHVVVDVEDDVPGAVLEADARFRQGGCSDDFIPF